MRLDELRALVCVACGRGDRPLRKLPDSLWPNARACDLCLTRFPVGQLAQEADEVLAGATPGRLGQGVCLHCGGRVAVGPDGLYGAWCEACEEERRRL
jgi:hypothetical protein